MNRKNISQMLTLLSLTMAILIVPSWGKSSDADQILQANYPNLYNLAGGQQAADYVIVIDKSGSMKTFAGIIKTSLSSFVEAIPDGDYLSVVVFGSSSNYFTTPTPINSDTREVIRQAINGLRGSDLNDPRTDLGKGLEKCLDELNRPGGNNLKFSFFLTDFNHDPPSDSPYRSSNANDDAWQKLARRRQNEQADKVYDVTALLLPLEKDVGRNLNLGTSIFPHLRVERVTQQTLGSWFERRRAEIARDRLKARVSDDLRKVPFVVEKLEAESPLLGSRGRLIASIRSNSVRLIKPVSLHKLVSAVKFVGQPPDNMKIIPIGDQVIAFGRKQDSQQIHIADVEYTAMPLIRSSAPYQMEVILDGLQEPVAADEVHKLDLDDVLSFHVTAALNVDIPSGRIPPPVPLVAVLLLVIGLGWVAYRRRPEYLQGELVVSGSQGGARRLDKSEKKTKLIIGNVSRGEGIQVPGVTWRLSVRTFKPGGAESKPRGVYACMENGSATLSGEALTGDWKTLPKGSKIEVQGRTIGWN